MNCMPWILFLLVVMQAFADEISPGGTKSFLHAVTPASTYRITTTWHTEGVADPSNSVVMAVSWLKGKQTLQRDYLEKSGTRAERVLRCPEGADAARLDVTLRWTNSGKLTMAPPTWQQVPALGPRTVRVAVGRVGPISNATVEKNVQRMLAWLDKAGQAKAGIALLPETIADWGTAMHAEPIPGPITARLAEMAKKYAMYVATSLHESDGGKLFNTAILLGRDGRIVGKYRKVHLPLEEAERGFSPGHDYPVFTTDFGKVGMLICWDHWFPESARILRLAGAELLLLPLAGDGDARHWDVTTRARAMDNTLYLAASSALAGSPSRIVSPTGEVLGETEEDMGLAVHQIDLAAQHRLRWLSVGPGLGEPASLYLEERRPSTYRSLAK